MNKIFLVFILFLCIRCAEEKNESLVLTEEVIFTSADVVRILGRVLEANGFIDDHGFQISTTETFETPLVVSLGPRDNLGRFFGEFDSLNVGTSYFIRSFISISGELFFGNVISLTTAQPVFNDFNPKSELEGNELVISGNNIPQNVQVFFNDEPAEVLEVNFESEITVEIPAIHNSPIVSLSVVIDDSVFQFEDQFEYIIGRWEQEGLFVNDNQYKEGIYFELAGKLVYGLGVDGANNTNDLVWELDFHSLTWAEVGFTGVSVRGGFADNGFIGGGAISLFPSPLLSTDFLKYDVNFREFNFLGQLPFEVHYAIAETINSQLYVFGGIRADGQPSLVVYLYNVDSGEWVEVADAPVSIHSDYPSFVNESSFYYLSENATLYEFSVLNNEWSEIAVFPDNVGKWGFGKTLNDKAYVGLFERSGNIWEFDFETSLFSPKVNYTGVPFERVAAVYTFDGKIFILRSKITDNSFNYSNPEMELWSFDPQGF